MRAILIIGGAAMLAGCGTDAAAPLRPPAEVVRLVPTGARIEASGFATIERAPSPNYSDLPPPAENRPASEAGWYARSNGISEAEAAKRIAEQQVIRPELERVMARIRASEPGNFTATRMVHQPDWAYVFYFKRNPAQTLARYSANPRFKAALARYTRAELDALVKPWAERFMARRLLNGYGSDETYGTAEFDMALTEAEYSALATREKWVLPDAISLRFGKPLAGPAVAPAAAGLVRVFAQNDRLQGIVLASATVGRIVLRHGCLYVDREGAVDPLAYFAREASLIVDDAGYLAIKDRQASPAEPDRGSGRIAELFVWGGYGEVREDMAMVGELRARCGAGPIAHVGSPTSLHHFRVRPFAIDDYAIRRRISRQRAWDEIKACWAKVDASGEPSFLSCDTADN